MQMQADRAEKESLKEDEQMESEVMTAERDAAKKKAQAEKQWVALETMPEGEAKESLQGMVEYVLERIY